MREVQFTTLPSGKLCMYIKLCKKDERFTLVNEYYGVMDIALSSDATRSKRAVNTRTANIPVCRKKSMMFPNHLNRTNILNGKQETAEVQEKTTEGCWWSF